MATIERPIRFDSRLLAELDQRSGRSGEDVSGLVNSAVDRYLHGDRPALMLVHEPTDLALAADTLREALMAHDAPLARAVVRGALDGGATVLDVHVDVIGRALQAIGHGWARDEVSIAEEHFATEVIANLVASLGSQRRVAPTSGRLAIVAASPDELHVLGARMVAGLLERAGWEVIALGAATPAAELLHLAAAECPDLVAVSTSTAGRVPGLQEVLLGLVALDPRPYIAVGGPLYSGEAREFAHQLGADLATADLRELLVVLRERFGAV